MNSRPNKDQQPFFTNLLYKCLILFLTIYGFILILVLNHTHVGVVDSYLNNMTIHSKTLFFETFGNENANFKQVVSKDDEPVNVYNLLLQTVTNIKFNDIRSLMGSEIPGFSSYNAKIFVAGKGVNYTNLPEESPPPPKNSLPDKENENKDNNENNNQKNEQNNPSNSIKKKVVYIYHSHSWESYLPALENKSDPNAAVSNDPSKNVLRAGKDIQDYLAKKGIGSNQDTTVKKNYNQAYQISRGIVQNAMKKDKDLNYLIDIHRDASGRKLTTSTIKNQTYARVAIIIGEANPNYSANLYFAKQIHKVLDKRYPGLSRGIIGKSKLEGNGVYNQDLSKNAILIEIGGVQNTLDEVDRSANAFAEALTEVINSTN
ncbi:stage II sporulation protein P [Terrilactibacillus sp. BCM23-1]|uniref:Stage II sporulation protein P n=1 Tax=Terrilactibacillus tamarindi TaxID=2599694 RepID=A0A6N8CR06_9BACI|nr:stage II sporulation protein P [Terrilactibacillus tamarindi]MTT32602.1 stage II sporulation protein P [Terrilactibacillus tamarindi]